MFYIFIAAAIFAGDWKIKQYIQDKKAFGEEEEILNGHIIINKHHNHGAMLNFMDQCPGLVKKLSGAILAGIALLMALVLPRKGNRLLKLALAMITGGAAGNFYDRIRRGYVVDYFSFSRLKKVVFNLADIFIFVGSFILILLSLFGDVKKGAVK